MSRLFYPELGPKQTLAKLLTLYQTDHAKQRESINASAGSRTCPYCGKFWIRVQNSQLDGHAKCLTSPEFREQYARLMAGNGWLTYAKVAETLGVSISVARAWFVLADKRRQEDRFSKAKKRP